MGLLFQKLDQADESGLGESVRCLMTFDAVYTNPGGELLRAADVPFRVKTRVDAVEFETHPTFAFNYDKTNDREGQLRVYEATASGLTEVVNGTDLSAVSVQVIIKGR